MGSCASAARIVVGAVVAAAAVAQVAQATAADRQGVSVNLGRIAIDERLVQGGSYHLPVLGVRNPGTVRSSYRMGVSHIDGQREHPAEPDWFRFSPRSLELAPGATKPVEIRLTIPPGARPGDYQALLEAQIVGTGDGARVGAAAAARVTFEIEASSRLEAWLRWIWDRLSQNVAWLGPLAGLVLVVIVARAVRKRFSLQVVRRR